MLQVKNLSVAREMVKSMAIEALAAREAGRDADHAEGGGDKPGEDQVRRISCIFPNPGCDRAAAEEMQTCSTTFCTQVFTGKRDFSNSIKA